MSGLIKSVNPEEITLENILAVNESETFSRGEAAHIVGDVYKLLELINNGEIRCHTNSSYDKSKWFCNARDVLQNCEGGCTLMNIHAKMRVISFGMARSARAIGSEVKLKSLIADGSIHCEKPGKSKNSKWFCNAAQVLMRCRNTRRKKSKPTNHNPYETN